jgi:hypothetical protein
MLEMLCNGVVVLLPAIQRPVALETCCVVGICLVWFVVESGVRQLESQQVNHLKMGACNLSEELHTSAGEGRWCGHVIALGVFVPEDLRFSGFSTISKLARRAAKVSISEPMTKYQEIKDN